MKTNRIKLELYQELMDRTAVSLEYLDLAVGTHPVLKEHRKLRKQYLKAEDALNDLYQLTANISQKIDN